MRALALLVRRELRKRPGQFVAMVAMALLAGFLANIGLLLVTSYSTNVATKAAAWEAPDADGIIRFEAKQALKPGDFIDVRLTKAEPYDLIGTACEDPA